MGTYESLGKKEDMLSLRIDKIIDVLMERKDIGEAKVEYELFSYFLINSWLLYPVMKTKKIF